MATRDQLKAIIDQLPEDALSPAELQLEFILHPPEPQPAIERIERRTALFELDMPARLQRLREAGKTGNVFGWGGAGGFGHQPERGSYGSRSYSWWEGDESYATHRFTLFKGIELDVVEELSLSSDKDRLVFRQELYSGGRKVKREEEFPTVQRETQG